MVSLDHLYQCESESLSATRSDTHSLWPGDFCRHGLSFHCRCARGWVDPSRIALKTSVLEIACFVKEFIGENYAIAKADGNMRTDANISSKFGIFFPRSHTISYSFL